MTSSVIQNELNPNFLEYLPNKFQLSNLENVSLHSVRKNLQTLDTIAVKSASQSIIIANESGNIVNYSNLLHVLQQKSQLKIAN